MILSEGVPMTNGEVFALLRRRRDERNAKQQPSFGLQSLGNSSVTQQQTRRITAPRLGAQLVSHSAQTNLFFPPEAILKNAEVPLGGLTSAVAVNTLAVSRGGALLTSPAASHLVVLLTEVRVLRYLSRYSTISGNDGIRKIYGPSSAYNRQPPRPLRAADTETTDGPTTDTVGAAAATGTVAGCEEDEERNRDGGNLSCTNADPMAAVSLLNKHRPGTVGHVWAVECLLSLLEQKGRRTEREDAARVIDILRELQRRVKAAAHDGSEWPTQEAGEAERSERPLRRQVEDRVRKLFAQPAVPLKMFLSDQHSAVGDVAAVNAGASDPQLRQWTEQDVMRLVMARPKDSLDVYRVVENMEQLTGVSEELADFLETSILKVFA